MNCNIATLLACSLVFAAVDGWAHPQDADPCKCAVVNKVATGTASGTCDIPGQGSVPCFSASTATYPQGGQPQDGVCVNPPVCSGNGQCAYKDMQVTITIASCAGGCGVGDPVPWKQKRPGGVGDTNGTQSLNSSTPYTVNAAGLSNTCGTPEQSVYLEFYKKNGLVAFSLTFSYGCGSCPSMQ